MTAFPDEPEPIEPAEDLVEARAAIDLDTLDMPVIPHEPPPETDQMRLF